MTLLQAFATIGVITVMIAAAWAMGWLIGSIGVATWGRRRCRHRNGLTCVLRRGHPGWHMARMRFQADSDHETETYWANDATDAPA